MCIYIYIYTHMYVYVYVYTHDYITILLHYYIYIYIYILSTRLLIWVSIMEHASVRLNCVTVSRPLPFGFKCSSASQLRPFMVAGRSSAGAQERPSLRADPLDRILVVHAQHPDYLPHLRRLCGRVPVVGLLPGAYRDSLVA